MAGNKNIRIIAGISAAIIFGIIVSVIANSDPSQNDSNLNSLNPEISETEDSIQPTDSATVEKTGDYFIDEEGNKVYIIDAGDSPQFSDGG